MTKTENYQLPQWEAADPIRREDFNEAMANIDAAVAEEIEGVQTAVDAAQVAADAAQTAADAAWSPGNMPYAVGIYSGTGASGEDNPCRITVGFRPTALLVCPAMAEQTTNLSGKTVTPPSHFFALSPSTSGSLGTTVTWLDDGVSWYSSTAYDQCNQSGNTYFYIAFR